MLLHSVLADTVLNACRQTLAVLYQTELAIEGAINVILDKNETILVKINNSILKADEKDTPAVENEQQRAKVAGTLDFNKYEK